MDIYEEVQKVAQKYNNLEGADCLAEIVQTQYKNPLKKIIHREDVESQVFLDFEHVKIPAYNGYINHLTTFYGDYMAFPPIEKRGTWHAGQIFDPDVPYTEVLKMIIHQYRLLVLNQVFVNLILKICFSENKFRLLLYEPDGMNFVTGDEE